MHIRYASVTREIPARVVDASHLNGAEYITKEGNWWYVGSSTVWVILDLGVCESDQKLPEVSSISLYSSNAGACVKNFTLYALPADRTQGAPRQCGREAADFCKSRKSAWVVVHRGCVPRAPADPPYETGITPTRSRFWRLTVDSSYGHHTAINRLELRQTSGVISAVVHNDYVDSALAEISAGVRGGIPRFGVPGTMALYGANAFPIFGSARSDGRPGLAGVAGAASVVTTGAGGQMRQGRVVGFAHDQYIGNIAKDEVEDEELKNWIRTFAGIIRWCTSGAQSLPSVSVAMLGDFSRKSARTFQKNLRTYGKVDIDIVAEGSTNFDDTRKALRHNPHVLIYYPEDKDANLVKHPDRRIELLRGYVESGGNFIVAVTPWGWLSVWSDNKYTVKEDFLPNYILARGGMVYDDNYLGGDAMALLRGCPSAAAEGGCECTAPHLGGSLLAIREARMKDVGVSSHVLSGLSSALLNLPRSVFTSINLDYQQRGMRRHDERDDGSFSFAKLLNQAMCGNTGQYPQVKFPLKNAPDESEYKVLDAAEAVQLAAVCVYQSCWVHAPPHLCAPAPGIQKFPGVPLANAPQTRGMVFAVSLGVQGRQSTGLYVPPGRMIAIAYSERRLAGISQTVPEFLIHIGCHTDVPLGKETLERWPKITVSSAWSPSQPPLPPSTLTSAQGGATGYFASPFGGLLHVEVTNTSAFADTPAQGVWVHLAVTGAVRAPWYSLEREEDELSRPAMAPPLEHRPPRTENYLHKVPWSERLAQCHAPWAELEGHLVILSVPLKAVENVKNPRDLMHYWDEVLAAELDLSGQTLQRKERLVCDIQISAGYMHSGYPVMAHLDIVELPETELSASTPPHLTNVTMLRQKGSWGIFHEFGHNRQCSAWNFSTATEVTVNIFSLYVYYKLLNQKPYETAWFSDHLEDCAKYLSDPDATFESGWVEKYGVALGTYACLIQRFGFDFLFTVFRAYQGLDAQLDSDDDKRTEWIIQTSRALDRDLRSYYSLWKWPYDKQRAANACACIGSAEDWSDLPAELMQAASSHKIR